MSNAVIRSQNNIKAGIFVTISILIGLSVIFVLGDFKRAFQASASQYTVTFPVEQGIGGLGTGSFVDIGGIQVGEVDSVSLSQEGANPITTINVEFSIPADISIRKGAKLSVQSGMLSTSSWLSFTSMGQGGTILEPGGTLAGTSMSMLDKLLGSGPASSLSSTLDSFATISKQLEEDGELLRWVLGNESAGRLGDTIVTLQEAVQKGDEFLAALNEDWKNWSGNVDTLMAKADGFAEAMQNVSDMINQNTGTYQDIVDNLDSTIEDTAQVADTLRTSTWPKVESFIDTAQITLGDIQDVVVDVRARTGPWFADIDRTLANLTLASQQLNQLLVEVKASPWRLLYRPTDKQLGQELIYEASRNFVFGAADLKAAAGSMQRLLDARGETLLPDDPQLQVLRERLLQSAERYQQAQEQLMDVLRGPGNDSAP